MKNIILKRNGTHLCHGYEFDDLSEETRNKVIANHIQFWLETREYDEENPGNYEAALDEATRMQTPWFAAEIVREKCEQEIIQDIKANDYLFDPEGEILPITYHVKNGNVVRMTFKIGGVERTVKFL